MYVITISDYRHSLDNVRMRFISSVIRRKRYDLVVYDTKTGMVKGRPGGLFGLYSQATKRIRWMPWQSEAMKDVETCDKRWGAGKRALIQRFPNGETQPS